MECILPTFPPAAPWPGAVAVSPVLAFRNPEIWLRHRPAHKLHFFPFQYQIHGAGPPNLLRLNRANTGPPVSASTWRSMTWGSFPKTILSLMLAGEGPADGETDDLDTPGFGPTPATSPASSQMTSVWKKAELKPDTSTAT